MFKLGDIAVSRKLMLLLSLALVGFIALLLISASALHRNLMSEREARLQAVLDLAMSRIQALAATLPPEQAKAQAKAMLDSMRFDGDNYLFVLDEDRRVVVHPAKPELVGQQMGNNPAESHWQHMVDLGKGGHQGRLEYQWVSPSGEAAQKMSLVTGYQPWGWILGSGVLLQDIEATMWSQYEWMGGATLLVILLMGLLGLAISRSIVNPLAEINKAMARVAAGDLVVSIPVLGRDELGAVASSRLAAPERRDEARSRDAAALDWIKPRSVWLVVAPEMQEMAAALRQQIDFFGVQTREIAWSDAAPSGDLPLAVLFIPAPRAQSSETQRACIGAIRAYCTTSQLIYLGAQPAIETIVALMRSGSRRWISSCSICSRVTSSRACT